MNEFVAVVSIVAIISTFGSITFLVYLYLKTRHKERIALIENAQDATLFRRYRSSRPTLKWAFLAIAVGIGVFLGKALESVTTMKEGLSYLPAILICGGLALLLYYRTTRRDFEELDM